MSLFSKLFKRKFQGNYALSLDIGTEFIKALIFGTGSEEEKREVIGVGRQRQRIGDMQAGAVTDISGVVRSCSRAIAKAEEMCGIRPDQVIIGIAGELVKGSTTTVHYERLDPKSKIDLPELQNIVHKVQWKAFDTIRKQLSWETGQPEIDVKLINAAIVDVRIDGYRISNPLGFQGKEVSVGIFNAYAPLIHLGALETIASDLDLDLLSIVAEPYAVAKCMEIEDNLDFSAIFMDIGGGTTDIAVVRNGGMEGMRMFGLGGRAFTKRISQELGVSFTEAEETKIKYANKMLSPRLKGNIENLLKGDLEVWLSGVELSLSEFSSLELLPSKILLCGGGSVLPGIKESLGSKKWIQKLPFAHQPKIHYNLPEDILSIRDKTGLLVDPQDITPMALANLALDLAGERSTLSKILGRVVRMVQT